VLKLGQFSMLTSFICLLGSIPWALAVCVKIPSRRTAVKLTIIPAIAPYLKKMIINHDKSRIKIIHTIELTQGISIPEVNIPKFIPISAPAILTPVYMMYWK